MAEVIANMSMSLDGFIEDSRGGVAEVFAWTSRGEVAFTMPGDDREFRTAPASADYLRDSVTGTGALVCGRRLFDLAHGWGGHHPVGCPVFVVTHQAPADWSHPDAPFTFVTDGVASAIAQAKAVAGERTVAVASADVARQALDLGLLDAVAVDLVPVLLGSGTPFISSGVLFGDGVTHLHYRVRREG